MGCGASSRVHLSAEASQKVENFFNAMKGEGADEMAGLNRKAAESFFKGKGKSNFGKLSCEAMFNEVDTDKSDDISKSEFTDFWTQVKRSGYKDQEICDEIDRMMDDYATSGGEGETGEGKHAVAWVDWKDDRDVGNK